MTERKHRLRRSVSASDNTEETRRRIAIIWEKGPTPALKLRAKSTKPSLYLDPSRYFAPGVELSGKSSECLAGHFFVSAGTKSTVVARADAQWLTNPLSYRDREKLYELQAGRAFFLLPAAPAFACDRDRWLRLHFGHLHTMSRLASADACVFATVHGGRLTHEFSGGGALSRIICISSSRVTCCVIPRIRTSSIAPHAPTSQYIIPCECTLFR